MVCITDMECLKIAGPGSPRRVPATPPLAPHHLHLFPVPSFQDTISVVLYVLSRLTTLNSYGRWFYFPPLANFHKLTFTVQQRMRTVANSERLTSIILHNHEPFHCTTDAHFLSMVDSGNDVLSPTRPAYVFSMFLVPLYAEWLGGPASGSAGCDCIKARVLRSRILPCPLATPRS